MKLAIFTLIFSMVGLFIAAFALGLVVGIHLK